MVTPNMANALEDLLQQVYKSYIEGDWYNNSVAVRAKRYQANTPEDLFAPETRRVANDIGGAFAGTFMGKNAAAAMPPARMKLTRAENMELDGHGNEDIWRATGWYKGVDGKWKYEIPDAGATVNTKNLTESKFAPGTYGVNYTQAPALRDILEHKELYKSYPDIGKMPVRGMPLGSILNNVAGAHLPDINEFRLSYQKPDELRKTLLHEVQHAIQEREGFARGGNTKEFLPEGHAEGMETAYTNLSAHKKLLRDEGINDIALEWTLDDIAQGITPSEQQLANWKKAKDSGLLDDYVSLWKKYEPYAKAQNKATASYLNLAGEVESRNVEARSAARIAHPMRSDIDLRPNEVFPLATRSEGGTMPVAPRDQIIIFPTPKPIDHDPFAGASASAYVPPPPKYYVIDRHTKQIVGTASSLKHASRSVDRRDNAYGGYRFGYERIDQYHEKNGGAPPPEYMGHTAVKLQPIEHDPFTGDLK